jgi:hypothetical protein
LARFPDRLIARGEGRGNFTARSASKHYDLPRSREKFLKLITQLKAEHVPVLFSGKQKGESRSQKRSSGLSYQNLMSNRSNYAAQTNLAPVHGEHAAFCSTLRAFTPRRRPKGGKRL